MSDPIVKDPDAKLDYGHDWSDWLKDGETIEASTWSTETLEGGVEIVDASSTFDDTSTTVWLRGGTPNETYLVSNHVVTSDGREDDRSLEIHCRER